MKYKRGLQVSLIAVLLLKGILAGVSWYGGILVGETAAAQDDAAGAGPGDEGQRAAPGAACEQSANLKDVLEAIAAREQALARRERLLKEREAQVEVMEQEVVAKIARLEQVEQKLGVTVRKIEEERQAAGESLAKIYSSMKPADAARILSSLDEETVLKIFAAMKERNISQILPLVKRELAVALTTNLANRALIANSASATTP